MYRKLMMITICAAMFFSGNAYCEHEEETATLSFRCVNYSNSSEAISGELSMKRCNNSRYSSYSSRTSYNLGNECYSYIVELGTFSNGTKVQAALRILPEGFCGQSFRLCHSNFQLRRNTNNSILASATDGTYWPQNCEGIYSSDATLSRYINGSGERVRCALDFTIPCF